MAGLRKETDLKEQVLYRYEELLKERNEIEDELRGLQAYLKAIGEIKPQRRGPRKKMGTAVSEVKPKAIQKERRKSPARKARPPKPQEKVSTTGTILSLIEKSEKGISIDQIRKETGLGRLTVSGILTRMKKAGKAKGAGRGTYVKG